MSPSASREPLSRDESIEGEKAPIWYLSRQLVHNLSLE
jgi:hypothetical protein